MSASDEKMQKVFLDMATKSKAIENLLVDYNSDNKEWIDEAKLDCDIVNHMKFSWFDTDAYRFHKDDNEGYVFGILSWYGQYNDVDIVLDYYNHDDSDVSWQWFKIEQERDQAFNDETGRKFKRFSTTPLEEVKS